MLYVCVENANYILILISIAISLIFISELIESSQNGVLALLEDGIRMNTSLDLAEVIYKNWTTSPVLMKSKYSGSFIIRHYAMDVAYQTVK